MNLLRLRIALLLCYCTACVRVHSVYTDEGRDKLATTTTTTKRKRQSIQLDESEQSSAERDRNRNRKKVECKLKVREEKETKLVGSTIHAHWSSSD